MIGRLSKLNDLRAKREVRRMDQTQGVDEARASVLRGAANVAQRLAGAFASAAEGSLEPDALRRIVAKLAPMLIDTAALAAARTKEIPHGPASEA